MNKAFRVSLVLLILAVLLSMAVEGKASTFVCVVTKGEWVWLRNGPSKEAEAIGKIRHGVEVDVSEIQNGYAHVKWLDNEGWADVYYFEMPIKEKIYIVTAKGNLNKRETPDGVCIRRINEGARISVLGWRYSRSGELWAKVYLGGYCKAEFLTEAAE